MRFGTVGRAICLIAGLAIVWIATQTPALAQVRATPPGTQMTTFNPRVHGFKFPNTFTNDIVFDIRTGGLCGGMIYAALDFYHASRAIPPNIDYRPATGTVLERFLFQRQINTFEGNADKWAELSFNPRGVRNREFFRWGLQGTGGGRLQELRELIDRGEPVPLGLRHHAGHDDRPGDHQVLAIGYTMGGYRGDLGANQADLRIYIYDPNRPNLTMTLVPDLATGTYYYLNIAADDREEVRWLTYFVDTNYQRRAPPTITETNLGPNDGRVRELIVEFVTGDDDLRGGSDNVSVTINYHSFASQVVRNVNRGFRWIGNYNQFVPIALRTPVRPESIASIVVTTNFGGGLGGDNWDLKMLLVRARGGGADRMFMHLSGRPLVRFTGSVRSYTASLRWLLLDLRTGATGLPGGSVNMNVIVIYRGRPAQTLNNVNAGNAWRPNTSRTLAFLLDQTVRLTSVSLISRYARGATTGAWDMSSLKLRLRENGSERIVFERRGSPLFGFTPSRRSYLARIR
ncbi:MAG: hypothetical protein IH851_05700 [Armatimonadetes bacterium]|nr:hypothetical protein [Armatimonadota bacterium]